jgi:hypothetical protein
MNVSDLGPHRFPVQQVSIAPWRTQLLKCSYFRIERVYPQKRIVFMSGSPYYLLMICTKGAGKLDGLSFSAGQCWMIPARSAEFNLDGIGSEWILTYTASEPTSVLQECA